MFIGIVKGFQSQTATILIFDLFFCPLRKFKLRHSIIIRINHSVVARLQQGHQFSAASCFSYLSLFLVPFAATLTTPTSSHLTTLVLFGTPFGVPAPHSLLCPYTSLIHHHGFHCHGS
ncbi:hypothetical protein CEUSTIGMA_g5982.t1 [Chlamydomonas eustigma]|uniref:Uncharacterized protein n=1 Tax=Chlamydomonas eustigma TaxID=1157962 RepID=A0A250X6N2_9CHLO|nr:hypothetical protein CEUSTIGMA_g5982.t1 [Chlamydomonas eustigma]|eukprot:GAX78542.1 hypothetical protein CEUSTIGMA_g5982.t1 [Chlamydomonas eustigma]